MYTVVFPFQKWSDYFSHNAPISLFIEASLISKVRKFMVVLPAVLEDMSIFLRSFKISISNFETVRKISISNFETVRILKTYVWIVLLFFYELNQMNWYLKQRGQKCKTYSLWLLLSGQIGQVGHTPFWCRCRPAATFIIRQCCVFFIFSWFGLGS